MTALTTLPAPAAATQAGIPAAKTGTGADTAAGFGDALLALLAGPAPEPAPADLVPATEEAVPQEITPPVFDFTQSAPAQLALPSSGPAPDHDPAPFQDALQASAGKPVNPLPASSQPLPAVPAVPVAAPVTPAPPRAATVAPPAPAQALPADPGAVQVTAATQATAPALPAAQPGTRPATAAPRQGTTLTATAPAVPFPLAPAGAEQVTAATAPATAGITPAPAAPGSVPAKVEAPLAAAPRVHGETTPTQVVQVAGLPPASVPVALSVTAPPAPAVPVPAGYTAQLVKPVFSLATAGPGEHTMTVQVNPDRLGPVTLQAHIGAGGVRIEMFAASADGRDVLRQALPELRKDLAGAGINASLDLSSNAQSGSPQGGQDRETFTRRFTASNHGPSTGRPLEVKDQNARTHPGLYGPEALLDVMA